MILFFVCYWERDGRERVREKKGKTIRESLSGVSRWWFFFYFLSFRFNSINRSSVHLVVPTFSFDSVQSKLTYRIDRFAEWYVWNFILIFFFLNCIAFNFYSFYISFCYIFYFYLKQRNQKKNERKETNSHSI